MHLIWYKVISFYQNTFTTYFKGMSQNDHVFDINEEPEPIPDMHSDACSVDGDNNAGMDYADSLCGDDLGNYKASVFSIISCHLFEKYSCISFLLVNMSVTKYTNLLYENHFELHTGSERMILLVNCIHSTTVKLYRMSVYFCSLCMDSMKKLSMYPCYHGVMR